MKHLVTLCIIILQCHAFASEDSLKSHLNSLLEHSGIKRGDIGAYVTDTSKNVIFELNSEKHFIPASISKLITTAAVMNKFPPNTKFHTQIFIDGDQDGETLTGNIYLKGNGDPAFVSEKMWMLVDDFSRTGIKKITGNIIADDTAFDTERFDPGREPDRNDRAYDAPVGALSFDWNSTTIYVRPGKKSGDKARVFIDPENSFVVLKNETTTSTKGTDLTADRVESAGHDVVTVRGKIAVGAEEHHIYKDISNPPLYAAANLKEFLKQRGISVDGEIKTGSVPKSATLASDLEGEPLYRIINDMNKFSNNYIAEMLAKNLGQGKMSEGLDLIRQFLKDELHWSSGDFNLSNVSGFTRKNSFTPKQFVGVLSWLERHFTLYPEFLQSLPVSGVDGTLHVRMKSAEGWVRAKTGLLNGVVALSGYAGSHDGTVKLFTFIYNGGGDEAHVRDTFDSMASALVK
jgi:serine-type D-Ala-D-Ala carboxypeptidase/endopeptidase (penicillin-binding protein 4)